MKACAVPGCDRRHHSKGYCTMHRKRVERHGNPSHVTSTAVRIARSRLGQCSRVTRQAHSYVKFYGRHEHRVVAERMLGRELTRNEVVHHVNGDKHDNRPENLEVMTRAQHVREHLPQLILARLARAEERRRRALDDPPF